MNINDITQISDEELMEPKSLRMILVALILAHIANTATGKEETKNLISLLNRYADRSDPVQEITRSTMVKIVQEVD